MKKKLKKAIGATLLFIDKRWQELTLCFLVVSIAVLAFACFGWASPPAQNEISEETISDWRTFCRKREYAATGERLGGRTEKI